MRFWYKPKNKLRNFFENPKNYVGKTRRASGDKKTGNPVVANGSQGKNNLAREREKKHASLVCEEKE